MYSTPHLNYPPDYPMNQQLKITLWIALGGSLGTLARHTLNLLLFQPLSTLFVNILGSFLLAAIAGWATSRALATLWTQYGLAIGFCGAFTTMSALATDTTQIHNTASTLATALYLAASIAGGLLAAFAGFHTGKRLGTPQTTPDAP